MSDFGRATRQSVFSILLLTLLLGIFPTDSSTQVSTEAGITALAYDRASDRLFKSQGRAVFETKDGGKTWTEISLPAEFQNPQMLGLSADGHSVYVAEAGRGIFQKESASSNWVPADVGLPSKDVKAVATHATQPATLYAFIADQGIYRSQNAGKDWRKMDRGPDDAQYMVHTNMAGSMDSGWLYVLTRKGVRLSMDCFCLWRDIGDPKDSITAFAFDREQPSHVFAASTRGVLRSINGGQDWELAGTPGQPITALTVAASGFIFAGTDDGKLYRSPDGGRTWEPAGA